MTLNPATVGHNAYDLLDGSVSSFYADVDEAIAASEVVKGQYRYTLNPAYNSPNPVDSNSYTTVGLTQSGPMVVDLENTFITAEAVCNFTWNGLKPPAKDSIWFVGWKSSIEVIDRYEILVNSTPIYTQSFCAEESFIQYQTLSDLVMHTTPYVYTSFENVQKGSPNVCGTYICFKKAIGASDTSGKLAFRIPIKIPVSNFLPLRTLKYLMSWMGKWELRLYFTEKNMVVYPLKKDECKAAFNVTVNKDFMDPSDYDFRNLEEDIYCIGNASSIGKVSIRKEKMTFYDVTVNTAQFQIRMDVLEMLKQKYMQEKPLTFPVSTFQISRFTGPTHEESITNGTSKPFNIVLCQAINNCDTLFIIPFNNTSQRTCCRNPYCSEVQLQAGEYGVYPTIPITTYYNTHKPTTRFVNYVMDALNVNSSPLTSMNRSVANTFMPIMTLQEATSADGNPSDIAVDSTDTAGTYSMPQNFDKSNFFIPIPFSTDDDFQGGLSSPASNINFKLTGNIWNNSGQTMKFQVPWVAAFLVDSVIMIRPDPASDSAKVIWSDRTVC